MAEKQKQTLFAENGAGIFLFLISMFDYIYCNLLLGKWEPVVCLCCHMILVGDKTMHTLDAVNNSIILAI